jgi:hypothetical protein
MGWFSWLGGVEGDDTDNNDKDCNCNQYTCCPKCCANWDSDWDTTHPNGICAKCHKAYVNKGWINTGYKKKGNTTDKAATDFWGNPIKKSTYKNADLDKKDKKMDDGDGGKYKFW